MASERPRQTAECLSEMQFLVLGSTQKEDSTPVTLAGRVDFAVDQHPAGMGVARTVELAGDWVTFPGNFHPSRFFCSRSARARNAPARQRVSAVRSDLPLGPGLQVGEDNLGFELAMVAMQIIAPCRGARIQGVFESIPYMFPYIAQAAWKAHVINC
jgi:hypothetical protein